MMFWIVWCAWLFSLDLLLISSMWEYMQVKTIKQSSVGALFGSSFLDWQQLELEDMPSTSTESG